MEAKTKSPGMDMAGDFAFGITTFVGSKCSILACGQSGWGLWIAETSV